MEIKWIYLSIPSGEYFARYDSGVFNDNGLFFMSSGLLGLGGDIDDTSLIAAVEIISISPKSRIHLSTWFLTPLNK